MMPALIYTGLPPHVVLGTNKVQSACGTAMATLRYHRAGLFAIRPNLPRWRRSSRARWPERW
jgi:uncharacterized membrane protein YfcA